LIGLSPEIIKEIEAENPFVLATILSHKGSTPRTSGSRMMVRSDQTIAGTIGGGLVEARVMAAGAGMMDKVGSAVMEFTLDQELKAGLDMVCGGSLSVWLRSFVPPFSESLKAVFFSIRDFQASGKGGLVVTRISGGLPDEPRLVDPAGPAPLLPAGLVADIGDGKFRGPAPVRQVYALEEYMIEPFAVRETLFIFGAGHVGYQLGQMAPRAEFSTVVIDDRETFANPERFPQARQVLVARDFNTAFKELAMDSRSYIVILTRGHLHDQEVLEQALETDAAYIGMIGSRKKRDQIYGNLMAQGVSASRLEQIHSPIGTEILAETPAEIAVSILGELICERATLRGNGGKKAKG